MLHNQIKSLRHKRNVTRWNYCKTGLLISLIAVCFLYDRTYFFYPPVLAPTWNNPYFDTIGLVAGLVLFVCGIFAIDTDIVFKLCVSVSVGFLTVLLVAELFHVFGAGYYRFHPNVIFELYAIINLMQLAYERDPKKR